MLTPQMRAALIFIDAEQTSTGVTPSYTEIMSALGIRSKSHVHRILKSLLSRGFIAQHKGRARAIEILKPIPGRPVEPASEFAAHIYIPGGLAQLQGDVTTKIVDETLANQFGVASGDTLVLRPHGELLDGAVVILEGPGELYRLARTILRRNRVFLDQGREGLDPVPYFGKEHEYSITKRVIGLIRRMDQVGIHA